MTLNPCERRKPLVFGHCVPDCQSLYSASRVHELVSIFVLTYVSVVHSYQIHSDVLVNVLRNVGNNVEWNVLIFNVFLLKIRVSFGNNHKFYINLYLYSFSIYNFYLTSIYIFVVLLLCVMSWKINRCEEGKRLWIHVQICAIKKRLKAILITHIWQYLMI